MMLSKRAFVSEVLIFCVFVCTVMTLHCQGNEKALESTGHDLSEQVSDLVQRFGFQNGGLDQSAFEETILLGLSATEQLKKEYCLTRDIWVRSEICLALAMIGAKDAVPFLIDALRDDDLFNFHVKRFIIYALGKSRDPQAIDPLWEQIRRPDDRFSLKIKRTDGHKSKILQKQFIDAPADYFPFLTNDLIIRSLANIGGEKALEYMQQMLLCDDYAYYNRQEIQKAIERVKSSASGVFSPTVRGASPSYNKNAALTSLSTLLTRSPGDHHALSREQVERLLSLEKPLLLKHLRKAFDPAECSPTGKIPSQHAVILAGVYGGEDFRHGIEKTWRCDKKHSKELPPCEYYCSYRFALYYLDIRFRGKNPGPFRKEFYIANRIDKIADYLENLTEPELLNSVENKHLRPDIPEATLRANAGGPTDRIIEMNYKLAIYYSLGTRGRTIQSRDFLLSYLLEAYGHDASGDAVVNFVEPVLYQLAYRLNAK